MAVYNDSERVLKFIYKQREIFFDALKDQAGIAVLEKTPEFKPYRPSVSMEKQQMPPPVVVPPRPGVVDPKNKTKQVLFETSPNDQFTFEKENIDDNGNYRSILTTILAQQRKVAKDNSVRAGKPVNLTIHCPGAKVMKMKAEDNWTVELILTNLIKQAQEEGNTSLNPKPKAYLLRMAEDDGSPDEDFPPLNFTQTIAKFGKCFTLCKNPAFSDSPSPSEGDGSRKKSSIPSSGFLQINLPSLQYVKVPWVGSQTLSNLIVKVCRKRQLDPESYQFQFMDSDLPISGDLTLDELGTDKLMLCAVENKKNVKKR